MWIEARFRDRLHAVGMDIDLLNLLFEEHLSNKVQFLLDAIVGFIGIEQNDIFKVLTVFSVVGIFPTLVAGWYGMNFHNMPEYGWAYGYQFGIGAIVLSAVIPLAWFKWRGWLQRLWLSGLSADKVAGASGDGCGSIGGRTRFQVSACWRRSSNASRSRRTAAVEGGSPPRKTMRQPPEFASD